MPAPSVPLPEKPTDVFSTNVSQALDSARQKIADVGLRTFRVWLYTALWTGSRVDDGEIDSVEWVEILPPPKVRVANRYRAQEAGGGTEEGVLSLTQITRTLTREQLMGQGPAGGRPPRNCEFLWVLQPIGQQHGRTYTPAGEPFLRPTEWRVILRPTNQSLVPPE